MKSPQRQVRMIVLLALFITPSLLFAQNDSSIAVTGSGIVIPLFEALAAASGTQVSITTTVTGTADGVTRFCSGEADIAAVSRPMSTDEDANCASNNVTYIELLIGHNILTFVTQPGLDFAQCLTSDNLQALFAPSSEGLITNWNQVNSENPDTPLALIAPRMDSSAFLILDRLVPGDGIRNDAQIKDDYRDIVAATSETPGSLGVVTLNAALAAGDSIKVLSLDGGEAAGCVAPSSENVEGRLYGGATRLFLYVNPSRLAKPGLKDLLEFVVSPDSAAVVEASGFTAPSSAAYEKNRAALENSQAGRQFSQEVVTFQIPDAISGTINIAGAAHAYNYAQSVTNAFTSQYPGVTVNYKIEGEPAGLRRLCNGEMDLALASDEMSAEQASNCAANNIAVDTFDLGTLAVVLVANAKTDFLSCLTTNQLSTIWGAASTDVIKNWNEVNSDFPEITMTLFAPRAGDSYTDLLLTRAAGNDIPVREDVETNADPLYRAAAAANVEGALTFMSWSDYQRVLVNNQANIRLVAVDGGDGCVLPSPAAIADGSYTLTRPVKLIISRPSLNRVEVQSLLWYLASDDNYSLLEDAGLVGLSFGDLPALRETLQRAYTQAQKEAEALAASLSAEATQEPGDEATPEATPETTPDAGG